MSGRGAWRVTHDPDGVAVTVVDEAGNVVAFIARPKGYSPDDINRTARAIAAVPDLLGSAIPALVVLNTAYDEMPYDVVRRAVIHGRREALARAIKRAIPADHGGENDAKV